MPPGSQVLVEKSIPKVKRKRENGKNGQLTSVAPKIDGPFRPRILKNSKPVAKIVSPVKPNNTNNVAHVFSTNRTARVQYEWPCRKPACKISFHSKKELEEHNNVMHKKVMSPAASPAKKKNSSPNKFGMKSCKDCGQQFKNKKQLNRHAYTMHVKYHCLLCNKGFPFLSHRNIHLKSCQRKVDLISTGKASEYCSIVIGIS